MGIQQAINEYRALVAESDEISEREDGSPVFSQKLDDIVESNDLTAHELLGLLVEARTAAEGWKKEAMSHRGHYVEQRGIVDEPLPWRKP